MWLCSAGPHALSTSSLSCLSCWAGSHASASALSCWVTSLLRLVMLGWVVLLLLRLVVFGWAVCLLCLVVFGQGVLLLLHRVALLHSLLSSLAFCTHRRCCRHVGLGRTRPPGVGLGYTLHRRHLGSYLSMGLIGGRCGGSAVPAIRYQWGGVQ